MIAAMACVFLGAIDLTVIASILPGMIADLGVNTADIDRYVWAVSGYLIAYIVAIPVFGRASDVIGRQRTFVGCLVLFAVGSLLCGRAGDLQDLVVARTVQGVGGGGILPVAIALAGESFGPRRQLAGIGIVGAVETAGWLLGPIYGALVVRIFDGVDAPWRWVFWINIPLLLGALALVARSLRGAEARTRGRTASRLDVAGAVLLSIALVALCLAVASSGETGIASRGGLRALGGTPNPLADWVPLLLGVAAIAIPALVLWLRRAPSPLLPVPLFGDRAFVAAVMANVLAGMVLMVVMVNVPVVVSLIATGHNVSLGTALLLAPFTAALAIASLASNAIVWRIGQRAAAVAGMMLAGAGLVVLSLTMDGDRLWTLVPGLTMAGIGLGIVLPPLVSVPVEFAPVTDRGAAASTALMFRLLGMTLGTSVLTSLGVRRLQVLTGRVEPIVQGTGESTASLLERQRQFIEDHAVPLSVQVLQETFLVAAGIALVAIVPLWWMSRYRPSERGA